MSLGSTNILNFSPAATQGVVKNAPMVDKEYVIGVLTQLADYLLGVAEHETLFGHADKNLLRASVYTLYSRLLTKRVALSTIASEHKSEKVLKRTLQQRVAVPIRERKISDFEDLFYSLAARMLDMQMTLNNWLHSGFIHLDSILFEGGPTVKAFHDGIAKYWNVFNHPMFLRTVDECIRATRIEQTADQIFRMVKTGSCSVFEAEPYLRSLCDNWDECHGVKFEMLAWSPAMIAAYLEEKYRVILRLENKDREEAVMKTMRRAQIKIITESSKRRNVKLAKRASPEYTPAGISKRAHHDTAARRKHARAVQNVKKNDADIADLSDRMGTLNFNLDNTGIESAFKNLEITSNTKATGDIKAGIAAGIEQLSQRMNSLKVDSDTPCKLEGDDGMDVESQYSDKRQDSLHREIEHQLRVSRLHQVPQSDST